MHLLLGRLLTSNGTVVAVPDHRDVSNGWAALGSTHIVGEQFKPVPSRLELEWFSYAEDRFYGGSWSLPSQEMDALFRKILPDHRGAPPHSFNKIYVGVAPEGFAAVWMGAGGAEIIEIGNYQGAEIDRPWKLVIDNPNIKRKDFIARVLDEHLTTEHRERLRREGVPAELFKRYHKRYNWKPYVSGTRTPRILWMTSFNGEHVRILGTGPVLPRPGYSPPEKLRLEWLGPNGDAYATEIALDEAETLDAFEALSSAISDTPIELEIAVSLTNTGLWVRTAQREVALRKASANLYRCC